MDLLLFTRLDRSVHGLAEFECTFSAAAHSSLNPQSRRASMAISSCLS